MRRHNPGQIGLAAVLWIAFFALNWVANTLVVWLELTRAGSTLPRWEPAVWEGTSALATLMTLPAIVWFDRRFPLQRNILARNLPAHVAFTLPFSVAHVGIMVALRNWIYALNGRGYDFGHVPTEFLYEYLKDFRSYAMIIALIYLYRFVVRRWHGEAELLSEQHCDEPQQPVVDRFLVKKLGREFLVRVADIDWAEAAGNYVNLHVGGKVYPLRQTMKSFVEHIGAAGFRRVHRSFVVNLARVVAIAPSDSGDATVRLAGDTDVPVSRRYLAELRDALAGSPPGA